MLLGRKRPYAVGAEVGRFRIHTDTLFLVSSYPIPYVMVIIVASFTGSRIA